MKKDIDCIAIKRLGQERLRTRLEGLSREQELAFWAERSAELVRVIDEAKRGNAREQSEKRPA